MKMEFLFTMVVPLTISGVALYGVCLLYTSDAADE